MGSGEDIQAGRPTGAESTTFLVGSLPDGENPPPFNGNVILQVGPFDQSSDLDLAPRQPLVGIRGIGANSPIFPDPSIPGTGVEGWGSVVQGTGVAGLGGGPFGYGGTGVHGQGGRGSDPFSSIGVDPGIGVVGQGGERYLPTDNVSPGPGVVGLAGGAALPSSDEMKRVGVYGKGADGSVNSVTGDVTLRSGAGIIGQGGLPPSTAGLAYGVGVVGLAGGVPFPDAEDMENMGIYGQSMGGSGVHGRADAGYGVSGQSNTGSGVSALTTSGTGVEGYSEKGHGASFASLSGPQLGLSPAKPKLSGLTAVPFPMKPTLGDFFVFQTDPEGNACQLWFFAGLKTSRPNVDGWEQLAGPSFP